MNQQRENPANLGRKSGALSQNEKTHSFHYLDYSTKTPIFVKGKTVGHVQGKTFYKTLRGSKHFLRTPAAIAFDTSTLLDARSAGADRVKVKDVETGITYTATIQHIFEKGKEFNRGWGNQIYLTFEGWIKEGKGIAVQHGLFEGGLC